MSSAKRARRKREENDVAETEGAPAAEVQRAKMLKRALGLVARAAHAGTPEEEARTSALVASKIIHEEKLLEPREPRHPLFDRLEGFDDGTLDLLAGIVEAAIERGAAAGDSGRKRRGARAMGGDARSTHGGESSQAVRWREEALHLQRRLDTFAGSLRWILQGYKIGLMERPGYCAICRRPLVLGEMVVWKRRRIDCVHYTCCVAALQQQGAIPYS